MTQTATPRPTLLGAPVPRRSFMKWSAAAGGAAAAVGIGAHYGLIPLPTASAEPSTGDDAGEKVVWNSCNVNCGSRCPLLMTVVDGAITRIDADPTGDDELGSQQIRACVRGRSIRQRIYSPDRLKHPMKRVGKRGAGEFEQITWEEAFDTIADSLKKTLDEYGNEAVYVQYGSGTTGANASGGTSVSRLMNLLGGNLGYYGTYSTSQINAATPYTYGVERETNNSFNDAINTKLLVLWGNNPHETRMSGGGELYIAQQAKEIGGAKVIVIDPRQSDTAVTMADEWVPLRPGTDGALVAGMAHVMVTEGLHDQAFLDTYCVGFDEEHLPESAKPGSSYKAYLLGDGPDGVEKTPEWAAPITGVPAATIRRLAREIAQAKPCAIVQGWGPQRHANGEATVRAIYLLAAMTGNVGLSGGGLGAREGNYTIPTARFPGGTNPIATKISCFTWTDAIERGPEMTATADGVRGKDKLDVPIKFIWNHASNTLINQHSDINRTIKLLEDDSLCEMIVVIDNQLCASAKFADILLPDVSNAELTDLIPSGYSGDLAYAILAQKAIEPLFECRSTYDICAEIADRMGIKDKFTEGKTLDEWVEQLVADSQKAIDGFPSYDELATRGIWRKANPAGFTVGLKKFRDDPMANPLKTPSGKIEIYSERLQEIADTWEGVDGEIPAIPAYVPSWEGHDDPLTSTYPLQMIGHHYKSRTHSSYGNVAWLKEAHPQVVWVNTLDAKARGIENDDVVHVFNDRGRIELLARVTTRIAPGVLSVPQGAWYAPDKDGVDKGGSTNTLTSWHPSPLAKGNPQHTNLVQIEKA
ncbi:DMSO/selenate family reductase complex A subunit [Cellulomonas chengniuliangii]|uniref:DMSO/selenate family reductase complex A subunit n=1 Tax=Cellulomonas chengniuliangii TaxID=2968084 RepID=UPI001D0DDA4A|nr:DMSO/selenate family reductase complex A subunit [Cellulomonas chengniuliangii]MCC2318440.1 molybdopterin-dependent oxidoreductase [Cellulomonas chengniuliangii]